MATNPSKILCASLLGCLLTGAHCRKYDTVPCHQGGYAFLATAEWSPQQETYRVGDTLYLTSTLPKTFTDQINTSMVVDYSNSVGIGGTFGMGYVDTIQRRPVPGRSRFDVFAVTGRVAEGPIPVNQVMTFNYAEQPTEYRFKCGIVCKQKGVYLFSVSDLRSPGIRGKNCTNAGFAMRLTNSEKNFHLYEGATGIILDAEGRRLGYSFRVE